MLLRSLREGVSEPNLELVRRRLALYAFGGTSGISCVDGPLAITPCGVAYEKLTAEQIIIADMVRKPLRGKERPSSDLPTHIELYRLFKTVGTHRAYPLGVSDEG